MLRLLWCELTAFRFPERAGMTDTRQEIAKKTEVIDQFAVWWQWIGCSISNRLVVNASFIGVTQEQHEKRLNQEDIFHGVTLFLAAVTAGLFMRVVRSDDRSLGSVLKKGAATVS